LLPAALLTPVMACSDIETVEASYAGIRRGAAWRVVPRDGVIVTGPGARDWLQGQLSQDVSTLGGKVGSAETLVLSPQGKIDCYSRVASVGEDRFLLDVASGYGNVLFERLRRFKLRVKADLELVDGLHMVELRGPYLPAGAGLGARGVLQPLAVIDVGWPGWSGRDVVFTGDPTAIDGSALGLEAVGAGADEAFDAARIEAGVPRLGAELTERTIPQEAGDLVDHSVSFTKGCYTGQELVARLDARGSNTPRRLRGLVIEGDRGGARPAPGDALLTGDGDSIGELTSAAWSPGFGSYVALGYLKRSVDVPAGVSVRLNGEQDGDGSLRQAAARSLPLFEE
jgi:folate-binding protein YgfZ